MRKRLRKKLRRGEYTELAFPFAFTLLVPAGSDAALDIIDALLAQVIEPMGMAMYAGGMKEWSGVITTFARGTLTSAHQAAVLDWLRAHPGIEGVRVGPLIDAWHSRDERFDVAAA